MNQNLNSIAIGAIRVFFNYVSKERRKLAAKRNKFAT